MSLMKLMILVLLMCFLFLRARADTKRVPRAPGRIRMRRGRATGRGLLHPTLDRGVPGLREGELHPNVVGNHTGSRGGSPGVGSLHHRLPVVHGGQGEFQVIPGHLRSIPDDKT